VQFCAAAAADHRVSQNPVFEPSVGRLKPFHKIAAAWKSLPSPPLLRGWEWVVVTFIVSRLIIFGVMYLARLEFGRGLYWHPGPMLTVLLQFDAELWYIEIARSGYNFSANLPSSMGFFPFFPLLIRIASPLFTDIRIAALVVAHVCFLLAGILMNALINLEFNDRRINRAAVMFLMFGPVSFFFSNAYSESTFLMLACAAFLAARQQKWLVASLCGACLSATRNIGVLIAIPLVIEYLLHIWRSGFSWKALLHPRILIFGIVPLGLAAFLFFGYWKFGDPFAYFKATAVWGRSFTFPQRTIANREALPVYLRWNNGGIFIAAFLIWVAGFFTRMRASYMVWTALLMIIYICGSSLEGVPRYLSIAFPLFLILGQITARFPSLTPPLLGGSVALLTIGAILSAAGFWIT